MSRYTFYKCDPTDLLDGIADLNDPALIAMYVVVINRIYQSGGSISNSEKHLGQFCGLGPRKARAAIDQLLQSGKLFLVDGRLMNARCQRELDGQSSLSRTRAESGEKGGKATAKNGFTDVPRASNERSSHVGPLFDAQTAEIRDPKLAENREFDPAIASTRARQEKNREEEPPLPPTVSRPGFVWDKPNFDDPLTPAERDRVVQSGDLVDRRDARPPDVDVPGLTSRIMIAANMAVPPTDLVLVSSWVKLGIPPEKIMSTVNRMAGTARGSIRAMRYFDAELRRIHDTEIAHADAVVIEFRNIAQRAQQA